VISSVGLERCLDKAEVNSSSLLSPTFPKYPEDPANPVAISNWTSTKKASPFLKNCRAPKLSSIQIKSQGKPFAYLKRSTLSLCLPFLFAFIIGYPFFAEK